MVDTMWLRYPSGLVREHDAPLHEAIADQLTKGVLTRVNPDGSAWSEPADPADPGGADVEVKPEATAMQPPAKTAPKAEWVGYAVRAHGVTVDDADALTKADLIEKYGGTAI